MPWLAHALPDADEREEALSTTTTCDCCGAADARACGCSAGFCFEAAPGDRIPCPQHCPCRGCRLTRGERAGERIR